jgi:uncharacterized membrane protein
MQNDLKLNTVALVSLIGIIMINYFLAESRPNFSILIICLLSLIKFFAVTFQFMEVKTAHIFWKVLVVALAAVYLIGIVALR